MEVNVLANSVLAVVHGYSIIFDENDEEGYINILEKVDNFAEETVPRFTNRQFKEHFRMNPDTFEDLLQKLHSIQQQQVHPGQPECILEKQVMVTIWCLANMESLRSVSSRFGISKSTCWSTLYKTCYKILEVNRIYKIVWWPTPQRCLNITRHFRDINGFPGVVGCIDGSHIRILPPKDHPNSYFNRKKFHSVLLQGICDHQKLFTDIYTGEPGSMHDQRLFEKSNLYYDISQGLVEFPNNTHIIGDLAYKLSSNVMVGFKNNGELTNQQKNFNSKLSQIRVVIENAFALLKGRFRRLKYLETIRLDLISLLICAACILHNICILNSDIPDEIMNVEKEIVEERRLHAGIHQDMEAQVIKRNAEIKRNGIVNNLRLARNFCQL